MDLRKILSNDARSDEEQDLVDNLKRLAREFLETKLRHQDELVELQTRHYNDVERLNEALTEIFPELVGNIHVFVNFDCFDDEAYIVNAFLETRTNYAFLERRTNSTGIGLRCKNIRADGSVGRKFKDGFIKLIDND